jgi:hypothetical protein
VLACANARQVLLLELHPAFLRENAFRHVLGSSRATGTHTGSPISRALRRRGEQLRRENGKIVGGFVNVQEGRPHGARERLEFLGNRTGEVADRAAVSMLPA